MEKLFEKCCSFEIVEAAEYLFGTHTVIVTFLVLAVPVVVFFFLVFFLPSLPALVLLELEEDPAFVVAVVEHLGKSLSTEASMEDSVED